MGEIVRFDITKWSDEPVSAAIGFVQPGVTIDLAELAAVFRRQLPDESVGVHHSGGLVDLVAAFEDEWMVRVLLKDGVQSDARHMATEDFLREHPRATDIASCDRMVEVMVADPQASVAAFEVLDAAREWLLSQSGVVAINPDTGKPL